LLGRLVYASSPSYARRLDANLRQSGLCRTESEFHALRQRAVAEAGKAALEAIAVWVSSDARLHKRVRRVSNRHLIEDARKSGRGILILTPHLGCFELVGFYCGQMMPMTVLYRPPRLRWLEPLMTRGRRRGHVELAATDIAGVRRLLRALKRGDAVAMLPDQAPRFGDGTWAAFFGRPAYTMTLCLRLIRSTACVPLLLFVERLPKGRGFEIHVERLGEHVRTEAELNKAVEDVVRLKPEQYFWGYDRYKVPSGVAPPTRSGELPPRSDGTSG
jgi:KDO2-lipid IV(A) lauroyltransferase